MSDEFDRKMLAELKESIDGKEPDRSKWNQVALLSKEDIGLVRKYRAIIDLKTNEKNMLRSKIKAIEAQLEADSKEWWHHLKTTYGIPEGNLHITEDNKIIMEPKKK